MKILLSLLAVASAAAGPAAARTAPTAPAPPAPVPAPAAPRTVTLPPDAIGVREAVQAIAAQTGQRILIGPGVTGTIGINLNAVPLEAALTAVTKGTGNTWSRLPLPPETAKTITAAHAADLARAADLLAASGATVRTASGREVTASAAAARASDTLGRTNLSMRTPDGREVILGAAPGSGRGEVVYVVRAEATAEDARAEQERKSAEVRGTNLNLAEDAKSDPAVVDAYAALKSLSPDQMAVVTREFITHITPDEARILQQSFQKQREQMKQNAAPQ